MNEYGAIKSPKDLRDYKINRKIAYQINLPSTFSLGTTTIKSQGNVGSCVAHTISEILEFYDGVSYSTSWIYGYRPLGYTQSKGMISSQALKTIHKVGYLTEDECPGNIEMANAKKMINLHLDSYKEQASKRKITSYAKLRSTSEIKESLYINKVPVLLVIKTDDNGLSLLKDYTAKVPTSTTQGKAHAIMCYGWNEKGLLVQNSWGKNWGLKGTFIVPYNYPIVEAWMITKDSKNVSKPNFYAVRDLLMKAKSSIKSIKSGENFTR